MTPDEERNMILEQAAQAAAAAIRLLKTDKPYAIPKASHKWPKGHQLHGLTEMAGNALLRAGFDTRKKIRSAPQDQLLAIPGFGRRSYWVVQKWLGR